MQFCSLCNYAVFFWVTSLYLCIVEYADYSVLQFLYSFDVLRQLYSLYVQFMRLGSLCCYVVYAIMHIIRSCVYVIMQFM